MSKVQDQLFREYARTAANRYANAAVALLTTSKHSLLGDESGLKSTWEEICVQVQGEKSYFWSAYEAAIHDAVLSSLFSIEEWDRRAIWLQTDAGWDWHWDLENGDISDNQEMPIDDEDIVTYISNSVLQTALDFESERVCRFLCPSDDSLYDDEARENEMEANNEVPPEEVASKTLEIEYYDDSWDSGKYFVCINRHYIFAANPKDELPEWTLLNSDYQYWDAVHQRIYRNFRADRISKEDLPANLPPPPDSIPPEALNPPPPAPLKQFLAADYPVLNQYLHQCDGGASVYFLVLGEDQYESLQGDGRFHYPEAIFFDLVSATAFKQAPQSGYRYHIRPGLILLDGDHIECQLTCRLFDHFNSEMVLSMLTAKLETLGLDALASTTQAS